MRMTRRNFVSASLAAGAMAMIPRGAAADSEEAPIVGAGEHRYQFLQNWGQLPPNIEYGLTHGVAVDKARNVYVLHTSTKKSECKDTVVVFDSAGKFLRSWGSDRKSVV